MLCRLLIIAALLLSAAIPASGVNISRAPAEALSLTAARLKEKDFKGARDAAMQLPAGGERDFLLGITAARLADWEEAVPHLARAAENYPLLADYALYHQAQGLYKLGRFSETHQPLQHLLKQFPDSPLLRAADLLLADALLASRDYQRALDAYRRFVEKYAVGTDAMTALYQTAQCREQLGDVDGAVTALKNIWLTSPAAPLAARAEADLQRLADRGAKIAPYSGEELFRRAATLYDLRKFDLSVHALSAIPLEAQSDEFTSRVTLKIGQTLFRARRYREAEQAFNRLLAATPASKVADEASFWLARCLDRSGKEDEAFSTYLKLAETFPASPLADNALLEAAMIRKYQRKEAEALPVLRKLLTAYPTSDLKQTALWETAWNSFLSGDLKTAADFFQQLTGLDSTREKALYWHGRTLAASGDIPGAQTSFASLLAEFPLGYYAHAYRKDTKIADSSASLLPRNVSQLIPLPAGFERVKALIAFGLYDEAGKELARAKKKLTGKNRALPGIARLYLEMGDYHSAMALFRPEFPRRLDKDNVYLWGLNYPLAFSEQVDQHASACGIPAGLVYAIIRAESNFFPAALSPAGAIGLMQLMPATAKSVASGKNGKFNPDQLTRPEVNIKMGIRHLQDLLAVYNGNQVLAVAAYNAGAGNVNRWLKSTGNLPRDAFIESIPFAETREYVKKVLAGSENYNRFYSLDNRPAAKTAALSEQQVDAGMLALVPSAAPSRSP